jgi:membrane protein YqaA with SNARE-associated domain
VRLVAAAWGFAEATLFFIVPDVWVSLVAVRRGLRPALFACLFATAGAIIGGAVMYGWAGSNPAAAVAALDRVPAVSPEMIERVEGQWTHHGFIALLAGAFTGTPYKVYAVKASVVGIPLGRLLLLTIPARLPRFVLVALVVHVLSTTLLKNWKPAVTLSVSIAFWAVFYVVFLSLMPG